MSAATTTLAAPRSAGGLSTLAGTGKLLRFQARRTRVYLSCWLAGIAGFNWVMALSFPELYPSAEDRAQLALSSNTPAMRSMTGPVEYLDAYADSAAAIFVHQIVLWIGAATAVMFILLITRLTRADEETSRLEVIRSNPVGRRADLAAALLLAGFAAIALGALMALSVAGMDGFGLDGAVLYGLLYTTIGLVFAAITAVAAQLAGYASTANGLGFATLGFAVLTAAVGNAQDNWVTWLSPVGWSQLSFVTTPDQRWWPTVLALALTAILVGLSFSLVAHRDFGQGLLSARGGRAEARPGLRSASALTFRLTRGTLWSALITMAILGAAYGSIFGSLDDMLAGMSDVEREIIAGHAGTLEENFAVTVAEMDAFIATLFGLLVVGRARTEETGGRGELLAATPVRRSGWPGSYLPMALFTTAVGVVAGGLSLGAVGAATIGDGSYFGRFLGGALVQIPAVWVMVALAFAVFGWLPRAGWLRWLPWVYAFVAGIFGDLLDLPGASRNVSPYEHTPQYPAQEMDWLPMIALLAVAAAITWIAYIGVNRRNLQFA